MATDHRRAEAELVQGPLLDDPGLLKEIVQRVVQELLEAEMTEHIGAAPYERNATRSGQRNGYKPRTLRTRVGTLNLLPQDREGTFCTRIFARYQRNKKALVLALMEMYVEGVSTRKVKEVTEELCGTSFSKSLVSRLAGELDSELQRWRDRPLHEKAYPYLFVDARYEKARVDHRIVSEGVLIVYGINEEGYREILGVEVADTESEATYHVVQRRRQDEERTRSRTQAGIPRGEDTAGGRFEHTRRGVSAAPLHRPRSQAGDPGRRVGGYRQGARDPRGGRSQGLPPRKRGLHGSVPASRQPDGDYCFQRGQRVPRPSAARLPRRVGQERPRHPAFDLQHRAGAFGYADHYALAGDTRQHRAALGTQGQRSRRGQAGGSRG
jgi:hypothetical protein